MKKGIKRAGRRLRNLVVAAMVLSMVFATDVSAAELGDSDAELGEVLESEEHLGN